MSYQLRMTKQPGYLHFRISGENTPASVSGYLKEIYAACVEQLCSAVLVEENLAGPSLDVGEIFQIASVGSAATAPVIRAIAYVDVNPEHTPSKMQFAETVAVTRGINIRLFDSASAAAAWLEKLAAGN